MAAASSPARRAAVPILVGVGGVTERVRPERLHGEQPGPLLAVLGPDVAKPDLQVRRRLLGGQASSSRRPSPGHHLERLGGQPGQVGVRSPRRPAHARRPLREATPRRGRPGSSGSTRRPAPRTPGTARRAPTASSSAASAIRCAVSSASVPRSSSEASIAKRKRVRPEPLGGLGIRAGLLPGGPVGLPVVVCEELDELGPPIAGHLLDPRRHLRVRPAFDPDGAGSRRPRRA